MTYQKGTMDLRVSSVHLLILRVQNYKLNSLTIIKPSMNWRNQSTSWMTWTMTNRSRLLNSTRLCQNTRRKRMIRRDSWNHYIKWEISTSRSMDRVIRRWSRSKDRYQSICWRMKSIKRPLLSWRRLRKWRSEFMENTVSKLPRLTKS